MANVDLDESRIHCVISKNQIGMDGVVHQTAALANTAPR